MGFVTAAAATVPPPSLTTLGRPRRRLSTDEGPEEEDAPALMTETTDGRYV